MSKELKWGIFILIVILSAFAVPYLLLNDVQAWYGSFLYWIVMTIVVIFANFFISKDWSN